MNLSTLDLVISAHLLIISTLVSNLYQTIWGYVYAIFNIMILALFSLFKDSWSIKNIVQHRILNFWFL